MRPENDQLMIYCSFFYKIPSRFGQPSGFTGYVLSVQYVTLTKSTRLIAFHHNMPESYRARLAYMNQLAIELDAVNNLPFVADAYPYKDNQTIIVVLKSPLRNSLPPDRSILSFQAADFTVSAVIQAYKQEVVLFLVDTLRTAEDLLARSTVFQIAHLNPIFLN